MQRHDNGASADGHWLDVIRAYLAASAALHLTWEMFQLPLYTIWRTGTWGEIAFAVAHCTAGDVMIAALSLLAALIVLGNNTWPRTGLVLVMAATITLGASYTIYSEWVNTVVRKSWAYAEIMPVVPILGTGVAPLLQWLVVPSIAFAIALRFRKTKVRTATMAPG